MREEGTTALSLPHLYSSQLSLVFFLPTRAISLLTVPVAGEGKPGDCSGFPLAHFPTALVCVRNSGSLQKLILVGHTLGI